MRHSSLTLEFLCRSISRKAVFENSTYITVITLKTYEEHSRKGIKTVKYEIGIRLCQLLLADVELGLERPASFTNPYSDVSILVP